MPKTLHLTKNADGHIVKAELEPSEPVPAGMASMLRVTIDIPIDDMDPKALVDMTVDLLDQTIGSTETMRITAEYLESN